MNKNDDKKKEEIILIIDELIAKIDKLNEEFRKLEEYEIPDERIKTLEGLYK